MRLLDVHQLTLEYFPSEKDRPQYAILSHTWGDGEITLQDLTNPDAESMPGYAKIRKSCEEARMYGLDYVWIDTCCIDKTSSAELSEAINSMYKWYQFAAVCFAYLSDVEAVDNINDIKSQLSTARWFTRGWTLQELLAPQMVIFYNHDWVEIGTKNTLFDTISLITDIPVGVLLKNIENDNISIAQRMSWVATRETTRTEDIAYCLMGIFNANMPTLYGEGENAFIRLQQEIMKNSDDHSLFAWSSMEDKIEFLSRNGSTTDQEYIRNLLMDPSRPQTRECGLLSTSPLNFCDARGIKGVPTKGKGRPFSMTNHGLQIWLPLVQAPHLGDGIYQAILDCDVSDRKGSNLTIYLKEDKATGQYSRILSDIVHISHDFIRPPPREIFVKETYHRTANLEPVKHIPTSHFRLHMSRNTSERTGYNILYSSVDSTREFVDMGYCFRQECAIYSLEYFSIGAKSDPSVQALIVVRVSDPDMWFAEGGQLLLLSNPNFTLDLDAISNTQRVREEIINGRFNTTVFGRSEGVKVLDLKKGWKISVSFRRGLDASTKIAGHSTNIGLQHYQLAFKFIPPDSLTDLLFQDRMPMPGVGLLSDCLPRLSVFVKPEFFTSRFWRNASSPGKWHANNSDRTHHQDLPNYYHGVAFCLPRSNWVKTAIQEDGYSYLWTPTVRQRKAVIALGLQKNTISKLLELDLDDKFKFRYQLRDPLWDLDREINTEFSNLRPEDLPDFSRYKINRDVEGYSRTRSRNFVITMKERIMVHEGGPMMQVEIKGLQYVNHITMMWNRVLTTVVAMNLGSKNQLMPKSEDQASDAPVEFKKAWCRHPRHPDKEN